MRHKFLFHFLTVVAVATVAVMGVASRLMFRVWLNEKSDETLAKLKEIGFEVVLDPKTAKLVIGRLPLEKLDALAGLTFVRYVAPQLSGK